MTWSDAPRRAERGKIVCNGKEGGGGGRLFDDKIWGEGRRR